MHYVAAIPQRNGDFLRDVHPAHRIAHQASCRTPGIQGVFCADTLRRIVDSVAQHPTHHAAQERYAPGNDQQPEKKSHYPREKAHRFLYLRLRLASKELISRRFAVSPPTADSPLNLTGRR